jgi:hypothetical protein
VKTVFIVGLCLIAAGTMAETVEVQPLRSSRHLQITVFWKGVPQADSKVNFDPVLSDREVRIVSYRTNRKGQISTQLPEGRYHVVASNAKDGARADLSLDVTSAVSTKSQFSMNLSQAQPPQLLLDAADRMPIEQQVNRFTGTVCDPAGRVIADALIEVLQKGSHGKPVAYLISDGNGHFDATLETGYYVAIFFDPEFRMKAVPFELKPDGAKDITVGMQVGQH